MTRSRDLYGEDQEDPTLPSSCACRDATLCAWHQAHFRGCDCRARGHDDVACRHPEVEEPSLREKLWRLMGQSPMGGVPSTDLPREAEEYLVKSLEEYDGTIRDIERRLTDAKARKRRMQKALSSLRELMPRNAEGDDSG